MILVSVFAHILAAQTLPPGGLRFVPVPPCRVVDTRGETGQSGPFGLPVMSANSQRDFPIHLGACPLPAAPSAYSFNVTVVPRGPLGYLTLWPTGQPRPYVSTLNSFDGRIKANAAIVATGVNGSVSVYVTDTTDVILDVNGYFVPDTVVNPAGYLFTPQYPPTRVVDTRSPFQGGPALAAGETRSFSFPVPAPAAYALNITAIPKTGGLSYLTVWPAGSSRPVVSTLNSPTGTVVANLAMVQAGVNGQVSVFVTDAADVVIDLVGYFQFSAASALRFFPLTPCRVSDTRGAPGPFGGPVLASGEVRTTVMTASGCGIPSSGFSAAQAVSLNVTAVPAGPLAYLTLFPLSITALPITSPLSTSTLNAFDGAVTSNAAIVPLVSGSVNTYATDPTHVILDVTGYFAF